MQVTPHLSALTRLRWLSLNCNRLKCVPVGLPTSLERLSLHMNGMMTVNYIEPADLAALGAKRTAEWQAAQAAARAAAAAAGHGGAAAGAAAAAAHTSLSQKQIHHAATSSMSLVGAGSGGMEVLGKEPDVNAGSPLDK